MTLMTTSPQTGQRMMFAQANPAEMLAPSAVPETLHAGGGEMPSNATKVETKITYDQSKQNKETKPSKPTSASQLSATPPGFSAPDNLLALGDPGGNIQGMISQLQQAAQSNPNQGQIQALQQYVSNLPEQQVDLSPLASLVDAWSGSNFAQSYKAPPQGQAKQALAAQRTIAQLQDDQKQQQIASLQKAAQLQMGAEKMGLDRWYKEQNLKIAQLKAQNAGVGAKLPSTFSKDYSHTRSSLNLLDDLMEIQGAVAQHVGPVKGLGSLYPYSEQQKMILATYNRVKQLVGKAMEGGVMRKEDESKYKKILPTIYDTPAVALAKIRDLKSSLSNLLYHSLDTHKRAGYNVSGFDDHMQEYIAQRAEFKPSLLGKSNIKFDKKSGKQPLTAASTLPPPPAVGTIEADDEGKQYKYTGKGPNHGWEEVL